MRLSTGRIPFSYPVATPGVFYAGTGQVEIPTWEALDLTGFIARENPCAGTHDALYARALAVCDGGRPAIILVADCLGFTSEFVAAMHAEFPDADLFLTATHTHSAPASQPLREAGSPDPTWTMLLRAALIEAGEAALRTMQPAGLFSGTATTMEPVAVNRRAYLPDIEPTLIDRCVTVLQPRDVAGRPLANLIHFACHPIVLGGENQLISADWPGDVCRRIEAATGAPALCLTGACGDINPARRGSWPELDWMGEQLAAATLRAIATSEEIAAPTIASQRERLPWQTLPAFDTQFLTAFIAEHAAKTPHDSTEARVIKAYITWANSSLRAGSKPASIEIEWVRLSLGDLALVGVPGELFVEIGMEMKSILMEAGYRNALICGFTNGNIGYIPARRAYAAGGYEIEEAHRYYGLPNVLTPEAGESLVAGCRRSPGPNRAG